MGLSRHIIGACTPSSSDASIARPRAKASALLLSETREQVASKFHVWKLNPCAGNKLREAAIDGHLSILTSAQAARP